MVRRIIQINEDKCNGCGACASACHEGAIGMVDGKAKLLRDDYCDGLGDCLPTCPTGAIKFVEREAAAYDEEAVKENMKKRAAQGKDGKPEVSETAVGAVASEHVAPQAGAVSQPTAAVREAGCGCFASRQRKRMFWRGKLILLKHLLPSSPSGRVRSNLCQPMLRISMAQSS